MNQPAARYFHLSNFLYLYITVIWIMRNIRRDQDAELVFGGWADCSVRFSGHI